MTRSLKVLILEDVEADAELMVHELEQEGFLPDWIRVDTEESYLAALASYPDLILSDCHLPQFDAFLALQLMQGQKLDIPFIVISGTITEDVAVEFMKHGASDYLLKDRMARLGQAAIRALEQGELREEKKMTEEAIHESEATLTNLMDSMPVGIQGYDAEGTVFYWNRMSSKIYGYVAEEAIGRKLGDLIIPEEVKPMYCEALAHAATLKESGEFLPANEVSLLRKDGSRVCVHSIHTAVCLPGKAPLLFCIDVDLTERRRAEEELINKSEDLARSNADLAQFAYVASHDLQEPLRMVTSYVQLLQMRYKGKLDPDADEFIGYVVEGTKRMKLLLAALLDYSRVGTQGNPFRIVECETVLENSLQNLRMVLDETKGRVTHDPLPAIIADETQMVQLFQNLISNGLKFHGPKPPLIHVSAEQNGTNWIFSIQDNGIGIDPIYFENIFIIFRRLHCRGKYPGTGVGLTIAKKIVQRHGGQIWVESEAEKGSTFYFTVPCKRPIEAGTKGYL